MAAAHRVEGLTVTLFDLTGRKAFVTGASRGIGQEIAVAFAELGADLALVARSEDGLAATAESLFDQGPEDLTREILDAVKAEWGLTEQERKN